MAVSSTAYTITANPTNISEKNKEIIARKIADMFSLDYEKTLKKLKKRSSIEIIVKKIDETQADEFRKWLQENKIETGINIEEDNKRYYPYAN